MNTINNFLTGWVSFPCPLAGPYRISAHSRGDYGPDVRHGGMDGHPDAPAGNFERSGVRRGAEAEKLAESPAHFDQAVKADRYLLEAIGNREQP